jgi:pantoate--beta-alanine ligase
MPSSVQTITFERVDEYRAWRRRLGTAAQSGLKQDRASRSDAEIAYLLGSAAGTGEERPLVGFVPTMGALHEGHATLIKQARSQCRHVVVSIFVNPLQFGPNEDFAKYPRTFPADERLCRDLGVDAILHPGVEEVYPRPLAELTKVIPPAQLIERLCGLFRPGHFEGVATVVMKLFGMVEPSVAYFGEKDFQQLAVIKRMVADLNFPVSVVGVPTVRESDGLALSSRNVYLTTEQRAAAPSLYRALKFVADESLSGRQPLNGVLEQARQQIGSLDGVTLQYLEACDPETLMPLETARRPLVVLVAAKFGTVRLIDNIVVR